MTASGKSDEPKDFDVSMGAATAEGSHRDEHCHEGFQRGGADEPVKLAIDSFSSTSTPRHTTPMERHVEDKGEGNLEVGNESQASHALTSRGHIIASTTPPKANAVDASNTHPSIDTLALARLYHSSRRSRHRDGGLGHSDIVSLNSSAPPPLESSPSLDSANICSRMDDLNERVTCDEEERSWSFTVASPMRRSFSSSSLSSIESVDREPKRRRTTPKR